MKKSVFALITTLFAPLVLSVASADEPSQDMNIVKKALTRLIPNTQPDSVNETSLPGMYEAVYGTQVIYVSADGRYMIEGDLYDMQSRENLTESKRQGGRVKTLASINEDSMIIFKPKEGKPKYIVTAFTDIDCGYCRKLHGEMAEYNKLGIEFRYVAYPRAGLKSPSYEKAVAVWCAVDRNKAMTFAKGGAKLEQLQELEQVADKTCKDPITQHYRAAQQVGVTGTPTLVMEDGTVLPGYVPAERLLKYLEEEKKKKS